MKKLLSYILVLAFALPLVAQESESKDEAKDKRSLDNTINEIGIVVI